MEETIKQLGLDASFFIQFALFCVFSWMLSFFYFRPFLNRRAVRQQQLRKRAQETATLMEQAEANLAAYRAQLQTSRELMEKQRDKALIRIQARESEVLNQARQEARNAQFEASEAFQNERGRLERELDVALPQVVETILGQLTQVKAVKPPPQQGEL